MSHPQCKIKLLDYWVMRCRFDRSEAAGRWFLLSQPLFVYLARLGNSDHLNPDADLLIASISWYK